MMTLEEDRSRYESVRVLLDDRRYGEAYERCRAFSLEGSISCKNLLGWMHHSGVGVDQDLNEAERLYTDTASTGSPVGQFYLGKIALMRQRDDEAFAHFKRAADQDYPPAVYRLALAYRLGRGAPLDDSKSREQLQRAFDLGHLFAQRQMALSMMRGEYGIWRVLNGVLLFASAVWQGFRLALRDPRDHRLIT